jgi:hypothetical protein
MRRSRLSLLMVLVLLMQGLGSAWASARMSGAELVWAEQQAELPPCHRDSGDEAAMKTMACCEDGACACAMACAVAPALASPAGALLLPTTAIDRPLAVRAVLHAGHHGPPLRPPSELPS